MQKSTIVRFIQTLSPVLSRWSPPLAVRLLEGLFLTPTPRPVRARERSTMEAATTRRIRFTPTVGFPVYSWGTGPTVLLVHGWSSRASQLAGVYVAPLCALGFRVVAFDAPGHGEADGRLSSLPTIASAVARVAAEIGPIEAILAHSLGTASTTIALSRGVRANRVVYVAPPEDLSGHLARLGGILGFTPPIAARTQRRIEARFGLNFEAARGATLGPGMNTPLLIVHDEGDREVPFAEGQRLKSVWPNAQLIRTTGLGHNRVLYSARTVEAVTQFLSTSRRSEAILRTATK